MSIPTPPVGGQVVGLAHYASRAALEAALARIGSSFNQSVALRAVSDQGGTVEHDRLVERLAGTLKIEASVAEETVTEMTTLKLLTETDTSLALTEHGREVFEEIRTAGNEIAARLYAGIPAEDLATVGRVLTLVTERANAELAGG
ncbi:MarR family transcriptional regulator [Streptomyces mirabilis]|uniref:MarR family transcriptional regulator n=1 Tax=Streptomyces mirabilis TaxID=68239 RepID=UPI0021C16EA1|nr:MarR family transcriptional regulator [Streptomyces mirabilis]MCT9104871.1 MarR family transcriptional regulator [Streptomyces mirabilis]